VVCLLTTQTHIKRKERTNMQVQHLKPLISLLVLSIIVTVSVAAQTDTPEPPLPSLSFVAQVEPVPLISQDVLAPGCELTSAEAGVFQVVCDEDLPPTTGIPAIEGELLTQGCELTTPEAGVFILDCETEPFEPVPMSPAPLTIQEGTLGTTTPPSDVAPLPDACDGAAGSYVEPGMEAIRSTLISFDDVIYNNQDDALVQYALYAFDATVLLDARSRFSDVPDLDLIGPFNNGDIVTIGETNICIRNNFATFRLWQLDNGEWVVDTIVPNDALDMTNTWPDDTPDPQTPGQTLLAPENPILVDGVLFRYLLPYIEPPITTMPGASQVDSGVSACEGTPPSFLSIGMEVVLDGYGYTQFPQSYDVPYQDWTFDNARLELGEYGQGVYNDILNTTPLTSIVGNVESVAVSPQDLYAFARPEGVVLDGPFCIEESVDPPLTDGGITEASDPAPDRFALWWQIDVNGQIGYYPETVGQYSWWLWETDGMFPRKLSLYYMVPNEQMTMAPACPTPGLFAGQTVQPGFGAMNLRNAPNGEITGRVDAGQPVGVFGDPSCEGGANWWQTDRGGFIAENDPESGLPLLVPYVPPTAQPDIVATAVPVQPDPIVTEAPPSEPVRPTEVPPREPVRPTTEPTLELELVPVTIAPTSPSRAR
jgi:hypothetical protein